MGFRPPYVVKRAYKWTYLYAAVEPTSGESFCMYLPGMDEGCLEVFLEELSKRYPDLTTFSSSSTARQAIAPSK
jgi:hypothetical protein